MLALERQKVNHWESTSINSLSNCSVLRKQDNYWWQNSSQKKNYDAKKKSEKDTAFTGGLFLQSTNEKNSNCVEKHKNGHSFRHPAAILVHVKTSGSGWRFQGGLLKVFRFWGESLIEIVIHSTKLAISHETYSKTKDLTETVKQDFSKITKIVPCELRAPGDFLKWRYNLLDMSTMRVAYYGLDSWLFSL